ncbi:MAG: hypothetical protein DMG49_11580 [Acidobacteria bacterium]|nr:MAG: hypothetical protein DMG49_11580 [Acidobacteriota bacterium]
MDERLRGPYHPRDRRLQKVNAVKPADVQPMTAQYIKPDQMTIEVVGDKSMISEQLAPCAATGDSNN